MEFIRHYTLDGKMELLFKQGEEAIALECTDGYESHYKHDQAICKLRYAQSLMQEALQEMKLYKGNPDENGAIKLDNSHVVVCKVNKGE